jgi:catechol 2,3-dioxygenase-like lactoylglutathione lyase family enzyme
MLQLKAIDHVALKVRDLDRTLHFYQQLGLTVLRTKGPNSDGLRFAVLQVGSQELNVACHPDYTSQGKDNAVGVDHFCFEVDATSIDEVVAGLKRAGIKIAGGPMERRDSAALILVDPDGVKVELQLKRPTTLAPSAGEREETSTR